MVIFSASLFCGAPFLLLYSPLTNSVSLLSNRQSAIIFLKIEFCCWPHAEVYANSISYCLLWPSPHSVFEEGSFMGAWKRDGSCNDEWQDLAYHSRLQMNTNCKMASQVEGLSKEDFGLQVLTLLSRVPDTVWVKCVNLKFSWKTEW